MNKLKLKTAGYINLVDNITNAQMVKPKYNMEIYESTVANTVQGQYLTSGGAKQCFLLDDTKWIINLEPTSLVPPNN